MPGAHGKVLVHNGKMLVADETTDSTNVDCDKDKDKDKEKCKDEEKDKNNKEAIKEE